MPLSPLVFDAALARQVKADTLTPCAQPTARGLKTASDFRQQVMIKYPQLADFHSRAEWHHAGLLEGDPQITAYVPQPFALRVGKRRYIPDCYVVSDARARRVVELKPRGEFTEDLRIPVRHFFAQYGIAFEVISNETVLAREIEAENWLEIVRNLHLARDLDTADTEYTLLETLTAHGPCTLGDVIDPGDRERTYRQEIALFRLLHRGVVRGELAARPLDYDTELALCA